MPSPEQPWQKTTFRETKNPLSPVEQKKYINLWFEDMEKIFDKYEPWYKEVSFSKAENPFKAKPPQSKLELSYQAFMAFMEQIMNKGELPLGMNIKESELVQDLKIVNDRYNWLFHLKKEGTLLSEAMKLEKKLELQPGEFFLENVPEWTELPGKATFKDKDNGFKFDNGWWDEYRETRPLTDFDLKEADLMSIGMDDPSERQALLASHEHRDSLKPAKIFDIEHIIREKKEQDGSHPDYLTTKELLEAINASGYRPATILELMAYARDRWKPEPEDPNQPLTEEEKQERCNAPNIYALGSLFTDSNDYLDVSHLRCAGGKRKLELNIFGEDWNSDDRFLVLRK